MPAQAMVSAIARLQTLGFFHMSIFRLVWLYKELVIVVSSRIGTDPWWKNIHGHQPLSKIDLSYKHFLRWFSNHRLPPWRSKKYRRMLKISQTPHVQKHLRRLNEWRARRDSNSRPPGSKSDTRKCTSLYKYRDKCTTAIPQNLEFRRVLLLVLGVSTALVG